MSLRRVVSKTAPLFQLVSHYIEWLIGGLLVAC